MWLIGGDDGVFTKPLPLYLYHVGLGGLSLQANIQGHTQHHKHFEELEERLLG